MLQNFPGLRNPVFCPVIRFSKNCIFDIYSFQGISGYKNFPGQKVSGFRFLPKSIPYSIFAYWTVSSNVLGCHMLNLLAPDAGIRFFCPVWMPERHVDRNLPGYNFIANVVRRPIEAFLIFGAGCAQFGICEIW